MAMLWSRWPPFGFGANTNYNSMTDIPRRFPDFIFGKGYSKQRKPERFKYRIILLVQEWPQPGLVPKSAVFSLGQRQHLHTTRLLPLLLPKKLTRRKTGRDERPLPRRISTCICERNGTPRHVGPSRISSPVP